MSLSTLLDRSLSDPLHAARSGRAIGYLGWNVPVELILAAGATPVQLSALPDSTDTSLADRFLENSFSAQSRVVAQRWLAGDLDCLDEVIFSRSDDNAQRLYYYLCELQRMGEYQGPRPLLYDLARIQRGTSVAHTIESTRALAAAIGANESRLSAAIQRVSNRERLIAELATLRGATEPPLGSVAYRIVRGARTEWSEEFDGSLQEWLSNRATVTPRKRVLLVGSVPSDDRLHSAIEVDGTVVVGEINEASTVARQATLADSAVKSFAHRYNSQTDAVSSVETIARHYGQPNTDSAVEIIARRYYDQTNAARTLLQSPANIIKAARDLRADGVIVWMVATDTGLAWQAPRIERALLEAGLPTLMLTSQPPTLSADALNQIAQFRRTLERQ